MLARVLIKPFGSIWRIRTLCHSTSPLKAKLARLLYSLYQYENNSGIEWNSQIKSEPCFPHGMKSIFISGSAVIGDNCTIFQQVTIGSVTLPDSKGFGAPVIGDNVYIGAGAKIVGAVTVGNNVRIGANTVVYQDVPDNSVVVSGAQRVITKAEPLDNRYYTFIGQWFYFDKGARKPVEDEATLVVLKGLQKG